jgi:Zn-dependent protease
VLFLLPQLQYMPADYAIASIVGILVAALVGMTIHEWAHNYVGYQMGDPNPKRLGKLTLKRLGKLTLNPMAHIYWPGFLMFVVIGFGILGTAPIAAHRMRNPRTGYLYAVAAGPVSNLLLAIVAAILYRLIAGSLGVDSPRILLYLELILSVVVTFNLALFLFNFLPFFPLDGWFIVLALLPAREAIWWERNAQMSQFVFFAAILIGFATPFDPLGLIIVQPLNLLQGILMG